MSENHPDPRSQDKSPLARLSWLFGWVQLAIIWERFWRSLWPSLTVAGLFISIALFDLLPELPYWMHWMVLAVFLAVFASRLRLIGKVDYAVTEKQIRDRIEKDSGLAHRPLTALKDNVVSGRSGTRNEILASEALWHTHQTRAAEQLTRVKAPVPKPGLAARDLFGARFAVLLIAVIAIFNANGSVMERLHRALLPTPAMAATAAIEFDIWITPPSYTGLAPLFLDTPVAQTLADAGSLDQQPPTVIAQPEVLKIPVESGMLVQVSGSGAVPELRIGTRSIAVDRVGTDTDNLDFRAEDKFVDQDQSATHLKLMVGEQLLAEWPIRVVQDQPPVVELAEPPKRTRRASLELTFEAKDDFSVKDVWAEMALPGQKAGASAEQQIRFDLTATGFGTPQATGRGERDYSAHRWAGLPILITLFAKDSAGQIGKSDPVETVLPARTFNHPVARALVEIRKDLNRPSIGVVEQSMETLLGLLQRPVHFSHDTVVFLSMSVARSRLRSNQSQASVLSVQKMLWETALRIEDGAFSIAERDLREIQERLAEAMRENAPSEEIDRLMDELQQALNKYMQALAEHMERQGLSEMPMDPNMRTMESMDLQDMVNRARELAKTGAMDAAKQMLSQLNRMLEGLQNGAARPRQNQEMAKAREMMNKLRDLAQRQQKLMDKTFRQSQTDPGAQSRQTQRPPGAMRPGQMPGQQQSPQSGRPNQQGKGQQPNGQRGEGEPQSAEAMRRQQDALRKELGRMMLQMDEMLGAIPPGLGQAERSMKGAGKSLGEGDATGAVPQQADALEKLQQGMESAAEQMAQRMQGQGQGMGIGMGMRPGGPRGGQRRGNNRDPFGRQNGEGQFGSVNDDNTIKVPSEREIYRAREIMDELHRRSGESDRQKPERDYIDRLLRRF